MADQRPVKCFQSCFRSDLGERDIVFELRAEIKRLRINNAALIEIVREGKCPYDGRYTVAECQQCGCSLGLFTNPIEQNEDGP